MKKTIDLLIFSFGIVISLVCFSCTSEMGSKHPAGIPGYYSTGPASNWDTTDWKEFHHQAMDESLLPIRQGEPGKSPFWNGFAKRFIHVPSFDFMTVKNSVKYRYTAISDVSGEPFSFEAENPWSLLTPVWNKLPVGIVYLKVVGLDKENNTTGTAGERLFYKAAPFNGPYNLPATRLPFKCYLEYGVALGAGALPAVANGNCPKPGLQAVLLSLKNRGEYCSGHDHVCSSF